MIRIAHLITTFYPGPAAHDRTFAIAADQIKRGWKVEFITGYNASAELIRVKQKEGFPVTQMANLRKYVHPLNDIKALNDLVRLFRKKKIDLVHTHWAKAGVLGRLAARVAGVRRVIHSVYGPTFAPVIPKGSRIIYWCLEKLAANFTDCFIFNGKNLRENFIKAGICKRNNSQVIYGGRDLSPFLQIPSLPEKVRLARKVQLSLDPKDLIIGYVARIVPSKGHTYALHAFSKLKDRYKQAKLLFVGGSIWPSEKAFEAKLVEEVRELGLESSVIFVGWQSEPAQYYSIFDIFIFPSLYEGLPGAILEARAADLPIVAFDCGGVREIVGDNCSIVPIKDVEGLASALKKEIDLISETRRRRGQNQAQLQRLQARFSVARMVTETGQLYERLLLENK